MKMFYSRFVAMVLTVVFIASCGPGTTIYYRQEENFKSPVPGGGDVQIGRAGVSNRYGTFDAGFIRLFPLNVGRIITLTDEWEENETGSYPVTKPSCNNFKFQAETSRTKRTVYRHQVMVEERIVHSWNSTLKNPWAEITGALLLAIINRGVDVAGMLLAQGFDISIVNQVAQLQKQVAQGGSAAASASASAAAAASAIREAAKKMK